MPRIGIFGSCVTRDLFEDPELRPALGQYTSRTTLASIVAEPVPIDPALVRLDSAFQRRCVLEDFAKTFFEQLAKDPPDFLVVDLIDERFELVRTDRSLVTRSSAFVSAGLDHAPGLAGQERVKRLTGEAAQMVVDAIPAFTERLTEILPPERVILHRAFWLTSFRRDGQTYRFPQDRVAFANHQNAALRHAYDALAKSLGRKAPEIALDPDAYAADAHHKWDLEPFHYEPDYNAAAVARLRELTGA